MKCNGKIPHLFRGAQEYRDDPNALEMAQVTFNEEGLYRALATFAAEWYRRTGRSARILDLCAATGLCALRVGKTVPVVSITLVDCDIKSLIKASERFAESPYIRTYTGDASEFRDSCVYDLVLANSAYHHIPDERKARFLACAGSLVAPDGAILIGEHFLPPYGNLAEFRHSVVWFYDRLLKELEGRREKSVAIDVIRRSALYCWEGTYEYKVSWDIFVMHCGAAGLDVVRSEGIWTLPEWQEFGAGTRAVWLQPRAHPRETL